MQGIKLMFKYLVISRYCLDTRLLTGRLLC